MTMGHEKMLTGHEKGSFLGCAGDWCLSVSLSGSNLCCSRCWLVTFVCFACIEEESKVNLGHVAPLISRRAFPTRYFFFFSFLSFFTPSFLHSSLPTPLPTLFTFTTLTPPLLPLLHITPSSYPPSLHFHSRIFISINTYT